MKKLLPIVSALAISITATLANADEGLYIGAKTGVMNIYDSRYDAKTPIALQAGYNFTNNFAIEGEYTSTNFDFNTNTIFNKSNGDSTTLALYGVYRSEGELYGKFKAGVLSEKITLYSLFVNEQVSDTGFSAGIGAGYRFENVSIEVEYTMIEKDIYFLSTALNYHF